MAIQMRRGNGTKFLPSKLLPGEWAIVLDDDPTTGGRGAYICFAAGEVKRMMTEEDLVNEILIAIDSILDDLTEGIDDATSAANTATANANSATSRANTATSAANAAANSANSAASSATSAASSATSAASQATTAAGRANSAADEAEAFLNGFTVEYSNLSEDCKEIIAESASSGATFLTPEEGEAIIDGMADAIATGRETGFITEQQGVAIIDAIFK
ncbi:MAG: hypothetical protein U0M51_04125 [Eggerthellaceae bacterium]